MRVAARQTGEVTLGAIRVPPPTRPEAVVVLKLTPDGKPIWGHALDGHLRHDPHAIATTATGDVVVGATFASDAPGVLRNDGFVAMLDGATGAPRWSAVLASATDDAVNGVAAAGDAIYVYGTLGSAATIAGQALAAGGYLIRYDADGAVRWARSLAGLRPSFRDALVVDPARGPVIVGDFGGDITLGDQTVSGRGTVVAAFDSDGGLRFARVAQSNHPSFEHGLAVSPSGVVYLAGDTSGTETVIDDQVIAIPDFTDHPVLVRLTADGHFAAATQITGERPAISRQPRAPCRHRALRRARARTVGGSRSTSTTNEAARRSCFATLWLS